MLTLFSIEFIEFKQVHTFYEAVGYMISAQVDQVARDALIEKYMALPNQVNVLLNQNDHAI